MKPLGVHIQQSPGAEPLDYLSGLLEPAITLSVGSEPPQPAHYRILVAGRPTEQLLEASPQLEALIIPYAGVPDATRQQLLDRDDIAVHNLHHNAAPTAEMAVALLLSAAKRVVECDRALRRGDWTPRYDRLPSMLLEGRTVLVLGFGAIGRRVARACAALDMNVVAVRARPSPSVALEGIPLHGPDELARLLPTAHALVVAVPLSDSTVGLIGHDELDALPHGAIVVNVSRGPVIDEDALYAALVAGKVGAAGLDVWWNYPEPDMRDCTYPASRPFHELENVVMSPHRAGSTDRTEELRMEHLAALLNAAARGQEIPNRVDLELGY
jgi:phosphoglycerate dehydrogenase-like enzyme